MFERSRRSHAPDAPRSTLSRSHAMPSVSIIIPCRNEAGHIEDCLTSVLAQEEPRGGFEVIVADGLSDDGTRGLLRKIQTTEPRVRMIDNPKRIASTGLNAAIQVARGEIIVRM